MLSKQRHDEILTYLQSNHIEMPEEDIPLNADLFEIMGQLTGNKLSTAEMIDSYDRFTNILQGLEPKVAVHVAKADRIKTVISLIESAHFPTLNGRLTEQEKEIFAFCIVDSFFVSVYDKEKGTTTSNIVSYTSVERVQKEYEYQKKTFPSYFSKKENNPFSAVGFGVTKNNPILTTGISNSKVYLQNLKSTVGKITSITRSGSTFNDKKEILDCYQVSITKGKLFKKRFITVLYINPYASNNSTAAPENFILQN